MPSPPSCIEFHLLDLQASQAMQSVQEFNAAASAELAVQIKTLEQELQQANAELLRLQGGDLQHDGVCLSVCLHVTVMVDPAHCLPRDAIPLLNHDKLNKALLLSILHG